MAKISDLIENFEGMSPEDKLAAVSAFDVPEPTDLSQYVKKSVFDKTASELAAAKKTIQDNMSAEEAAKAAKEAEEAERTAQLEELKRKYEISENKSELLKQGYSPELATEVAEAMADNDKARLMAGIAKHDAEREKALRAEMTRKNPKPEGGGDPSEEDPMIAQAKALGKASAEKRAKSDKIIGNYIKK